MKHNRGTVDLQRWMTRFQLTASRLIESWMDLIPDLDLTAPDVIAAIAQRRTAHQKTTPESGRNCTSYSWCSTTCCRTLEWWDVQTSTCTTQQCKKTATKNSSPLEWQFVSINFCKSGRLDTGSKEHLDEYHDTPWSNISSIQCARTQRSLFGGVLHYTCSSWQSNDATLWHGTKKIFPRHGWRWDWWNQRLLGRRWR